MVDPNNSGSEFNINKENFAETITNVIKDLFSNAKQHEMDWREYAQILIGLQIANPGKIKYDVILDAIIELENKIGEITFIPALNQIQDEKHYNRYLTYFFERALTREVFSGMRDSMEVSMLLESRNEISKSDDNTDNFDMEKQASKRVDEIDHTEMKPKPGFNILNSIQTWISNKIKQSTSQDDKTTIERYMITWDFIFKNFIKPIFIQMNQDNQIPDIVQTKKNSWRGRYWPNHLIIEAVEVYTKQFDETKILSLLTDDMNTRLRNAIVHEQYYVYKDILYYYYEQNGTAVFQEIKIQDLKEMNSKQFIKILIYPRVIGMHLGYKLGLYDEIVNDLNDGDNLEIDVN